MKLLARFLVLLLFAAGAHAADLNAAKAAGQIGEREDGYLGYVVESPPADVVALVQDINGKRRAEYDRIARSNGLSRGEVEALAGKKAMQKTASGAYVYSGGRWIKK